MEILKTYIVSGPMYLNFKFIKLVSVLFIDVYLNKEIDILLNYIFVIHKKKNMQQFVTINSGRQ